jgi:hypothetical protein
VFDSAGHYQRTVPLLYRTNVRHIALAANGDILVLGVDPNYFLQRTNSCSLLHRYTQTGDHMTSFSPCPANVRSGQTSGAAWSRLNFEVDRGSIWIKGDSLYQMMPASGTVRVFDLARGRWTAEKVLEPPSDGGPAALAGYQADGPLLWRLLPLANGQYLAQWISGSSLSSGGGGGRTSLAVHDSSGNALARGEWASWTSAVPIYSDDDGSVTFAVGEAAGEIHLVHGQISFRR